MSYPKVVHSMKWRFDYVFFPEKNVLRDLEYDIEKLCDSFVDVSHKKFPRKDYLMRISQSKNGNAYMIVRKKRGRLLGVEKERCLRKIKQITGSVFDWHASKSRLIHKHFYFDFKLVQEFSLYHFHFMLVRFHAGQIYQLDF